MTSSTWKLYRRVGALMARPYVPGENLTNVALAQPEVMPLSAEQVGKLQAKAFMEWVELPPDQPR